MLRTETAQRIIRDKDKLSDEELLKLLERVEIESVELASIAMVEQAKYNAERYATPEEEINLDYSISF